MLSHDNRYIYLLFYPFLKIVAGIVPNSFFMWLYWGGGRNRFGRRAKAECSKIPHKAIFENTKA